jgi:ketosteroid isomerase-like protein
MSGDNLARLKAAYARWADPWATQPEAWLELCDERVSFGSLGWATNGQVLSGHMALAQYLVRLALDWEMISFSMDTFVGDGERIVVLGRVICRNRETGLVLDTPKVDSFEFRNGKVVGFFEHLDTAAEQAARALNAPVEIAAARASLRRALG